MNRIKKLIEKLPKYCFGLWTRFKTWLGYHPPKESLKRKVVRHLPFTHKASKDSTQNLFMEKKADEQRWELLQEYQKMYQQLRRLNSLRWQFLKGITMGIGTTIGATLVLGIILTLTARLVNSFEDIPFVQNIIDNYQIDERIDELLQRNQIIITTEEK